MDLPRAIQPEIKKINCSRIFRFLYENGAYSRKDIAQALKLSIPTVVQNLRELEGQDLICAAGMLASTGGRKAAAVCLNPNAKYAVGLDVTQTHISVVLLNLKGDVLFQEREKIQFQLKDVYFARVQKLVEKALASMEITCERILGVGISIPAIITAASDGLEYSAILGPDITLESFERILPAHCSFCNDAKAASRAEQWGSRVQDDFIYLCLSNSVGGAIVQHGQLSEGQNRRSAEFGHMTIVPHGRKCYCGKYGCLDAYCNAELLSRRTDGNLRKFFELVAEGDTDANNAWDEYLGYLTIVVNNLRMAFDNTVVLGGYVGCYIEPYMPRLQSMVAARNTFETNGAFLKKCYYDQFEASAVGAALMYIEPFLNEI